MQKKAGIITHYNVHNYGAQLQLYAMVQVLNELGFEAKALTFIKNYDFMEEGLSNKYNISLKSIPFYFKYVIKNGVKRTIFNIKKKKTLDKFRKNNCLIGNFYSKADNLDVVVIGSDEIFSIEPGLNPCFWGMGVRAKRIISYAASFGPTTSSFIENHNAAGFIFGGIKTIDKILVRDRNSRDLIKQYGNKNAEIVCDPVLLYRFDLSSQSTTAKKSSKKDKKRYCLIYSYDYNMNDVATIRAIRNYSKQKRLKVYSIGYYHKWCDKNLNVDPLNVFKWFKGATMVFTDTFHGTVISLVTHTQFVTKITNNSNKLSFLLEQYGVSNRKVNSFEELGKVTSESIDYNAVGQTIDRIRKESMTKLEDSLNE